MKYISVYQKDNYGVMQVYPAQYNEEQAAHAKAIRQLTGRKTLTVSDVEALKVLGFGFKAVPNPAERQL